MVDYSKWKNIEISDDEDETHPNIDTPSLFRWRHQDRIDRMEKQKKEKDDLDKTKLSNAAKLKQTQDAISKREMVGGDLSDLRVALAKLELEAEELKKQEDMLKTKEKIMPWNVDTISQAGFEKTVINAPVLKREEPITEEERYKRMREFVRANEKQLKKYGMMQKYNDSKRFLQENLHLVCDDTANYLVIWCINLKVEEKHELANHVAHQCICMQYLLELAKQLEIDPRACVSSFFTKIRTADPEYKASFDDELESFKERISKRAKEKIAEAVAEAEEEERQARLGPGGLDPVEVFESLPPELKSCFESQDIALLQETIAKMEPEDAQYHMKRCVDSGMWVPEGNQKEGLFSQ